jgi:WD40 repeat protein
LAVGGNDGSIELLDMSAQRVARTWKDHSGPVYALAFHPQGHLLASGGADHLIRVWKVGSQEIARKIRSHSDAVRTLTFGPDGAWLASGSQDSTLRIHDLQQEPSTLHLPFKDGVNAITFIDSPNGVSLYADRLAGDVRGWALPERSVIADSKVPAHGQAAYPIRYADFINQGRVLISLSAEEANRLDFHDVSSGQPVGPPLRTVHPVNTFAIDPAVDWLVWSERFEPESQTIHWRELSTGMNHGPVVVKAKLIRALALDVSRSLLAVVMRLERSDPNQLMIIDTTGRTKPLRLMTGKAMYGGVAISPTDGTLAVAVDGYTYLFDPNNWQVLGQFSCATTTTHISFSPDGRRLATIGYDGIVHITSTDNGTPLLQLRGSNASARPNNLAWDARVAFSSDGAWLAANNWDGSLTVWSTLE